MDSSEKKIWGIHTKDENLFLNDNVIAIGWAELGDLSKIAPDRESFRAKMTEAFPDASKQSIANMTGQVFRFACEVKVGDYVIFPSRNDRMINIGTVEGEYFYVPEAKDMPGEYVNRKKVKWIKRIPRTMFTQGALYEAGSAMSLFTIKNYAEEYLAALDNDFKKTMQTDNTEDDSVGATADDIIDNTRDFILKELSRQLKGYDLEEFIADLLRAMGYRTTLSPHGGDSGIDITAYKDELPPRILVQVKSGDGDIKETTIQSLKGAMREGDYGLFVTLANYTKNAQKYLESTPIIRGINGEELVELILKYYELMSEKFRKLIPLKKVYIPVPKEDEL
ncbi:MAG: restriction endonuclease [Butyrivibrio sp.]|nr:restriction endonuclease [Butyrivibrio sp.]